MYGLDDMYLFKSVVDCGGLSAASRKLHLSKSTIARRVTELEKRLGGQLFHRSSRRFVLTNLGTECYESFAKLAIEADKVLERAQHLRKGPSGFLHVICPPVLGSMLIEVLAAEFASAAPDVRLHLEESTGVFDPRTAQADLIVYPAFKPLPDSAVVARKIFSSPYMLVARPEVLAAEGVPTTPQDLKSMPCLGLGGRDADWTWRLTRGRETALLRFDPFFSTTLPTALLQATRRGLGVASLPKALCDVYIARGELAAVLPDWLPEPVSFFAIYPSNRSLTVAGRQFLDLLVERLPVMSRQFQAVSALR